MSDREDPQLPDTGERMIPPGPGEVSFVWERHRFAYEVALAHVQDKSVLDVGCGTGYGTHLLAQHAERVVGIDRDPSAVAYCRQNYSAPNLTYRVADARELDLDDAFDVTLSFQVIEHLPDPAAFLAQLRDRTVPGGIVLITTPNVREPAPESDNPFHLSEMNAPQLTTYGSAVFSRADLLGIGYKRPNRLRRAIQHTPLYRMGKLLKRSSAVKRAADRALDLRAFSVLSERVAEDALDLLLIGYVDAKRSDRR